MSISSGTRNRNAAQGREYYLRNRERILAKSAAWYAANRARRSETLGKWHFAKKYGITPDDFDTLLLIQDNVCAICSNRRKSMCVDHDHSTGEVRGILCRSCNVLVGHARDNVAWLARAIEYLNCFSTRVQQAGNDLSESPLKTVNTREGNAVGRSQPCDRP
jgi:hypothetical protein